MPRGKIPIQYIANERTRASTYIKRSQGLKKKALEIATLCDVDVILVCSYDHGEPDVFPDDRSEAERIIDRYFHAHQDDKDDKRKHDLSSYLECQKDKLERKIQKKQSSEKKKTTTADTAMAQHPWSLNDSSTLEELTVLQNLVKLQKEMVKKKISKMAKDGEEVAVSDQIHQDYAFDVNPLSCIYPVIARPPPELHSNTNNSAENSIHHIGRNISFDLKGKDMANDEIFNLSEDLWDFESWNPLESGAPISQNQDLLGFGSSSIPLSMILPSPPGFMPSHEILNGHPWDCGSWNPPIFGVPSQNQNLSADFGSSIRPPPFGWQRTEFTSAGRVPPRQ